LPNSPGVDVVGVLCRVDSYTEKKYNFRKGERVLTLSKWGGNSRYLELKPEELIKVPNDIDPAEAACLPETYLSAFQVLHHGQSASLRYRSNALKGKSFLVVGNIQSNFGRAIGQLGAIGGAENVYATSKEKHAQKLVSFGMLPISNDPIDWFARLQNRIDLIISLDEPLTPLHYKVLKETGEVIVMTQAKEDIFAEADSGKPTAAAFLNCTRPKRLTSTQSHLYDVFTEWDRQMNRCKSDLQYLVQLLQERKISPYILDRIPLSKVARAHEMIELKRLPGFIVCEPWLVSKSRAVAL
jgi:NADPH:quinone reductase-like Zn-dependent oxidoreductase